MRRGRVWCISAGEVIRRLRRGTASSKALANSLVSGCCESEKVGSVAFDGSVTESCSSGSRGAADRFAVDPMEGSRPGGRLKMLTGSKVDNFCSMRRAAAEGFAVDVMAGLRGQPRVFAGSKSANFCSVRCPAADRFVVEPMAGRRPGGRLDAGSNSDNCCSMRCSAADGFAADFIAGLRSIWKLKKSPDTKTLKKSSRSAEGGALDGIACSRRPLLARIGEMTTPYSIDGPSLDGDLVESSNLLGFRGGDTKMGLAGGAIVGSCQGSIVDWSSIP